MALYTELLSEYLENGGELPAAFENIDGFTDLFKMRFYDREIGFETEELFQIKLELKADIYMPLYVKQLAAFEEIMQSYGVPVKTRVRTGGETDTLTKSGTETDTNVKTGNTVNENVKTGSETDENIKTGAKSTEYGEQVREVQEEPFTYTGLTGTKEITTDKEHTDTETYNAVTDTDTKTYNAVTDTGTETYNNVQDKRTLTYSSRKDVNERVFNSITDKESGLSPGEQLAYIEQFDRGVIALLDKLLNEFEPCFMQVY